MCTMISRSHLGVTRMLQHPDMVVASMDFKAKELVLVAAATTLAKKASNTSICVGDYEVNNVVFQLHLPSATVNLKKDQHTWAVPFWSVQQSEKPNMVLDYVERVVGDTHVQVPILCNPKKIKKGEVLTWNKEAPTVANTAKRQRLNL